MRRERRRRTHAVTVAQAASRGSGVSGLTRGSLGGPAVVRGVVEGEVVIVGRAGVEVEVVMLTKDRVLPTGLFNCKTVSQ